MADGVKLTVDPQSAALLTMRIRQMAEATGRETALVVKNAARDVAYAAQRFTPLARRTDPAAVSGKSGHVYAFIRHRYPGKRVRVPVPTDKANGYAIWENFVGNRRKVKSRGWHKSGWSVILGRLGKPRPTVGGGRAKTAGRYVSVAFGINPFRPNVEMSHDMPGSVKQNTKHFFVQKALTFVAQRMQQSLNKMRARLEATWRAAS